MSCSEEEVNVCLLENNLDACLESWSDSNSENSSFFGRPLLWKITCSG